MANIRLPSWPATGATYESGPSVNWIGCGDGENTVRFGKAHKSDRPLRKTENTKNFPSVVHAPQHAPWPLNSSRILLPSDIDSRNEPVGEPFGQTVKPMRAPSAETEGRSTFSPTRSSCRAFEPSFPAT